MFLRSSVSQLINVLARNGFRWSELTEINEGLPPMSKPEQNAWKKGLEPEFTWAGMFSRTLRRIS